tara:strand:- start:13 stop:246 length:234 start_codon:yes stop_codon:yes gene_type:complete
LIVDDSIKQEVDGLPGVRDEMVERYDPEGNAEVAEAQPILAFINADRSGQYAGIDKFSDGLIGCANDCDCEYGKDRK